MSDKNNNSDSDSSSDEKAGAMLRKARLAAGLDAIRLASDLRLSPQALEAIETSNYQSLPGDPYVRATLTSLARALRLDPAVVVKAYMAETGADQGPASVAPYADSTERLTSAHRNILVGLVLALAVGMFLVLKHLNQNHSMAPVGLNEGATTSDTLAPAPDSIPESSSLAPVSLSDSGLVVGAKKTVLDSTNLLGVVAPQPKVSAADSLKIIAEKKADSTKNAALKKADSTRLAVERKIDSIKMAAARKADSLKSAAARKADSLKMAVVRKTDSTKAAALAKQAKLDSSKAASLRKADSTKAANLRKSDSTKAAAIRKQDSVKTLAAKKADSLKMVVARKADSTKAAIAAKHARLDSVKVAKAKLALADSSKAARSTKTPVHDSSTNQQPTPNGPKTKSDSTKAAAPPAVKADTVVKKTTSGKMHTAVIKALLDTVWIKVSQPGKPDEPHRLLLGKELTIAHTDTFVVATSARKSVEIILDGHAQTPDRTRFKIYGIHWKRY